MIKKKASGGDREPGKKSKVLLIVRFLLILAVVAFVVYVLHINDKLPEIDIGKGDLTDQSAVEEQIDPVESRAKEILE